jgi:hypothetical protein
MNNKILIFLILILIYLIPELIYENAMLYLTSGVIGGSLQYILSNYFSLENEIFILIIWGLILSALIFSYYNVKNNIFKYILILMILIFLYIIDFIFAFIPNTIFDGRNINLQFITPKAIKILIIIIKCSTILLILKYEKKFSPKQL